MTKQSDRAIKQEALACRKAFEGVEVGALVWHCHHDERVEILTEPPENRIAYIIRIKSPDEVQIRLHLFRPVRHVFRSQAYAEWEKAYTEWKKANTERKKANTEWEKAYAEWKKANTKWEKACAEWEKADAEREKADVEWKKAYAEWKKADAEEIEAAHREECPDCPWDGYTIFPA